MRNNITKNLAKLEDIYQGKIRNNAAISKVVKFTESIVGGANFDRSEISEMLKLANLPECNLSVYKGILVIYYFSKFRDFPDKNFKSLRTDERFLKCLSLMNNNALSPPEIGDVFLKILTISDGDEARRDILMGCFYGALWPFMNNPKNFEVAIEYGIAIINSAFSLDSFGIHKKLNFDKEDRVKVISLAGSGKKEIKLLNMSSITAIVTAAVGKTIGENVVVEKTISRATSSVTGSSDIFELLGINLNLPISKMANISLKTKLGVFDINAVVPKLNRVYDGRLYNVQVFAGLVGGAAIVNPVDADLINYGLTRGSTKLCSAILNKVYPDTNILVLQGKDQTDEPVIDQISIAADTEVVQNIQGQMGIVKVRPDDFGFDFRPFKYIKTARSSEENLNEFIKVLTGRGNKDLERAVAMEVALNLFGLGIINDLKTGASLALETIHSGDGIEVVEDLVIYSNGDTQRFHSLVNI